MVKLFVGGLPAEIKEMDLAKLIIPHGNISTIKVVRDRQTRRCKGYAFVEMADEAGAEQAIAALNGEPLEDKVLTVHVAEEKPAAPPKPFKQFSNRPASSGSYGSYNRSAPPAPSDRPRRPRKSSRMD